MKRFQFKLEPIRQQRKWSAERCAIEYAQTQRNELSEKEHLREITQRYEHYVQGLERTKAQQFDATQIQYYLNYLDLIDQQRTEQEEVVREAALQREKAHTLLINANRDLDVMDTLYGRAQKQHAVLGQREEQRFLDDIGNRSVGTLQG